MDYSVCVTCRWHDAGTYAVNTNTGGPNCSIRNEEACSRSANSGLRIALDFGGNFCTFCLLLRLFLLYFGLHCIYFFNPIFNPLLLGLFEYERYY